MVANLGTENQEESKKDFRYDIKDILMPLPELRQKLWIRCLIEPTHEAETQQWH